MRKNFAKRAWYRIKKEIKTIVEYTKYYLLFPLALLLYANNEIYIVSERGVDARDNGYHMFSYLRKYHPEKECYFIIDKKSPDFQKVAELGDVVQYRSLRHYLLFISAKYKLSSHVMGYSPDAERYISLHVRHHIPGFHIFLQHGVIKDDIEGLYKENTGVDIFICGAKPECDFVSQTFHYGQDAKYTGLARYDALQNIKTEDYILFMPTWRVYLRISSEKDFFSSLYFQKWYSLLHNEQLIRTLQKHHLKLVFYPHFEMQKYIHLFGNSSDEIILADFASFDIQKLIKEAKMLVTDYSSVFFDFAYMEKPCVYYQFEDNDFYSKHYQHGYFDFKNSGFGEVAESEEEILPIISEYIDSNCELKEKYRLRIKGFFPLHDNKNCERIYEAIEALGCERD